MPAAAGRPPRAMPNQVRGHCRGNGAGVAPPSYRDAASAVTPVVNCRAHGRDVAPPSQLDVAPVSRRQVIPTRHPLSRPWSTAGSTAPVSRRRVISTWLPLSCPWSTAALSCCAIGGPGVTAAELLCNRRSRCHCCRGRGCGQVTCCGEGCSPVIYVMEDDICAEL